MEFPALTSRPNSWIQSISWPSWLDCRNTSSSSSLSASVWHIFSTSASDVWPYTSGFRVPSRFRLGPLSTSTDVMAGFRSEKQEAAGPTGSRPGRRGRAERRSDRGFLADALVLLARNLGRVLHAEVVQVYAVGLPRRERRDRRDDPDPEGDASDDQRHVGPAGCDLRVQRRQESGDQGADVLRHREAGHAGLRGEELLVEGREDRVVALVDDAPHEDREHEGQRCVALADRPQVG